MADNKQNDDLDFYDQDKACKYILEHLPANYKNSVTLDDVNYILDLEDDYYESKGFFDEDAPELVEIDEDEAFQYICDQIEKDGRQDKLTGDVVDVVLDKNYEFDMEEGIFVDDDEA